MSENKTLSPGQFHFLQSLTQRSRTGGGVLDYIEPFVGKLTKNQFHDIARSLADRDLVNKSRRDRSQIVDYEINDAGRKVLASYLPDDDEENRQTLA